MTISSHDRHPLALEVIGEGDPVVFLPGLTFDRHTWRPIVERLGGGVRSVLVDLPGHGDSGDGPTRLDPLVAALRAHLHGLGIDRPFVVGHSMSGGLALAYGGRHPVRGVVMVDSAPWIRPFAELLHQLAPSLRSERFAEVFFRVFQPTMGLEALAPDARELVLAHQTLDQRIVLAYWAEAMDTDPDALQDHIDEWSGAVRAPVLGVFGREMTPEERHRFARLPDAQVEEWPGRGHFVHLAEPDRFAGRLLAFVEDCITRQRPAAGLAR